MCESQGFYLVSQGYRKIPGNRCIGGLELDPIRYTCHQGYLQFLRTIVLFLTFGMATYFAYPVMAKYTVQFLTQLTASSKSLAKKSAYSGNLNQAPECLGESDDEDTDVGSKKRL